MKKSAKLARYVNTSFHKHTISRRMFLRCIRSSTLNSSSSYLMSSGLNISKVEPLISFSEMVQEGKPR